MENGYNHGSKDLFYKVSEVKTILILVQDFDPSENPKDICINEHITI